MKKFYIKDVTLEHSIPEPLDISYGGSKYMYPSSVNGSIELRLTLQTYGHMGNQDVIEMLQNRFDIADLKCINSELLEYMNEEGLLRLMADAEQEDGMFFVYTNNNDTIHLLPIKDYIKEHMKEFVEKYRLLLEAT